MSSILDLSKAKGVDTDASLHDNKVTIAYSDYSIEFTFKEKIMNTLNSGQSLTSLKKIFTDIIATKSPREYIQKAVPSDNTKNLSIGKLNETLRLNLYRVLIQELEYRDSYGELDRFNYDDDQEKS